MTPPQIGVEMTPAEVESLLNSQGHGVLCLGADDRGYGVPVSYAFDAEETRILMEFVNIGDSKKAAFLEQTTEATLTVHNYDDAEAWESVIVTGSLHELDDADVSDRSAARFFAQADDVADDLRWTTDEDVDRRWFELRPVEMTGRHGGTLPHQQSRGLVRFSGYDRTY